MARRDADPDTRDACAPQHEHLVRRRLSFRKAIDYNAFAPEAVMLEWRVPAFNVATWTSWNSPNPTTDPMSLNAIARRFLDE